MASNNLTLTDLKQQEMINGAFAKAGYSMNQLNNLTKTVDLSNNPEKQLANKRNELKQKLMDAEQNLKVAPEKKDIALKDYLIFTEGESEYKKILLRRYEKDAEKQKQLALNKHKDFNKELQTLESQYESQTIYFDRMQELIDIKINENKKILNFINNNNGIRLTNDRKIIYEVHEIDHVNRHLFKLKTIYYFILILYLIYGKFFIRNNYTHYLTWIILLIYIILPLLVNVFSKFIFYIVHTIKHKLNNNVAKNVYINL